MRTADKRTSLILQTIVITPVFLVETRKSYQGRAASAGGWTHNIRHHMPRFLALQAHLKTNTPTLPAL